MSWTEARVEKLKKLWEKGLSASQIADELGDITRNAVIGKAHRLGLSGRPSPVKSPPQKPAAAARPETGEAEKVTLLTLTERMCKWPIGHPGDEDFHFCGAPSVAGQPYCAEHAAKAYQSGPSKRDRRDGNVAARG